MSLRRVYWIVLRKELRELLRDKRSLFWLFAPPIILPGLALCAGLFIGSQALRIANDGFPLAVQHGERAPGLLETFANEDSIYLVDLPPDDPDVDPFDEALVLLVIPDDFQQMIDAGNTATIRLLTRDNSLITQLAKASVRSVIGRYQDQVLEQRLISAGLDRDWLDPIEVNEGRQAVANTIGVNSNGADGEADDGPGLLATIFLPLAVTSWMIGGGMGLILDTTVGEKDRQTIENLLVTPASRAGIVLGKLTVVFFASVAVMSLWMLEGLALNALSVASPQLLDAESLTPTETLDILAKSSGNVVGLVLALIILIVPFIIMLNGIMMAWSARAANYREANLFMVLMQLGLPASILITIFSLPATVSLPVYGVPFFGTIVAIRDLFSSTLSTTALLINVSTGSLYAALAIGLAAWVFNKEWSLTRGLQ
ncbi:MAG: ABC transporter permease [Anaerolineae bacterium]|nr:ABC transporter permease [Anaerolineae bacterium]